ncbi:MAG: response regulator [Rhodothermales bacterium]|nr:response regulator [Rhodothermales bacterium]
MQSRISTKAVSISTNAAILPTGPYFRFMKERILLVEDSPDQAMLMQAWLTAAGDYDVVVASDGIEGSRFARYGEWDLVISDIDLPGLPGIELLAEVKARREETPVLLVTGHQRMDFAVEALRKRADEFMIKPLDPKEFVAKAQELIASAKARRSASQKTVLAIGAHPDDVEIGVGGTLLRHAAEGDRVIILTLTGGEHGGTVSERKNESQTAADRVGAKLVMKSLPDTAISEGLETIRAIEETIGKFDPVTVYTHTPNDNHQDHRNTHRATVVAARNVANVYCYQAPSTTIQFIPQVFIDIAPYMDGKLELIAAYRSQVAVRAYLEDDLIRATARYWGRFAGYSLVEPMEVLRRTD